MQRRSLKLIQLRKEKTCFLYRCFPTTIFPSKSISPYIYRQKLSQGTLLRYKPSNLLCTSVISSLFDISFQNRARIEGLIAVLARKTNYNIPNCTFKPLRKLYRQQYRGMQSTLNNFW